MDCHPSDRIQRVRVSIFDREDIGASELGGVEGVGENVDQSSEEVLHLLGIHRVPDTEQLGFIRSDPFVDIVLLHHLRIMP